MPQTLASEDQVDLTVRTVHGIAARFLLRWTDPYTRNLADDIAQLATLDTLAGFDHLHDPRRLPGFVRTITRRVRFKMLRAEHTGEVSALQSGAENLPERSREVVRLRVCARMVDRDQLLPWLVDALAGLAPLNSCLLREFYGGCSCRELAARYRLSQETVKVRLHRSRLHVRASLEQRVAAAFG